MEHHSKSNRVKGEGLHPFLNQGVLEAGCDEAGRGCLAGPVVAAAVILPPSFDMPLLNDSKKLSHKVREILKVQIREQALAWAVAVIDNETIDQINILNASILGMQKATDDLKIKPEFLLIDGNRFKQHRDIPHQCVVGGDGKFASIAAASVLAKTFRDELMEQLHAEYPAYGWDVNRGYPTKKHREAIAQNGITCYHRRSFRLTDEQLSLSF